MSARMTGDIPEVHFTAPLAQRPPRQTKMPLSTTTSPTFPLSNADGSGLEGTSTRFLPGHTSHYTSSTANQPCAPHSAQALRAANQAAAGTGGYTLEFNNMSEAVAFFGQPVWRPRDEDSAVPDWTDPDVVKSLVLGIHNAFVNTTNCKDEGTLAWQRWQRFLDRLPLKLVEGMAWMLVLELKRLHDVGSTFWWTQAGGLMDNMDRDLYFEQRYDYITEVLHDYKTMCEGIGTRGHTWVPRLVQYPLATTVLVEVSRMRAVARGEQ